MCPSEKYAFKEISLFESRIIFLDEQNVANTYIKFNMKVSNRWNWTIAFP